MGRIHSNCGNQNCSWGKTAKVQEFLAFLRQNGGIPAEVQLFGRLVGDWEKIPRNYCRNAGIRLLVQAFLGKNCRFAGFTALQDGSCKPFISHHPPTA
jgi:hypothetical protein